MEIIAGDGFSGMQDEMGEDLGRLSLEADLDAVAAEFAGGGVELEGAKANPRGGRGSIEVGNSGIAGRHGKYAECLARGEVSLAHAMS